MKFHRDKNGNYLNFEFVIRLYKYRSNYDKTYSVNALIVNQKIPITIYENLSETEATIFLDKFIADIYFDTKESYREAINSIEEQAEKEFMDQIHENIQREQEQEHEKNESQKTKRKPKKNHTPTNQTTI